MGKRISKIFVWAMILSGLLFLPLSSIVFAYGGNGGGGDSGESGGSGSTFGGSIDSPPPEYDPYNIDPQFRPPEGAFDEDKESTLENTWGEHRKTKPSHWTNQQWRDYKSKRQSIFRHQAAEARSEHNSARTKHQIAKGVGYAAAAGGAVIGAVAAPAVAPTIYVVSVVGDGAAATAGSLAEGKSLPEAGKDGAKKLISSALLGKMGSGKTNAAIGFFGGQAYDNLPENSKGPSNQMPEPDGYGLGKQPHWK